MMGELVRLQKHLARAGVASRRAAEELILGGRVRVNGRTTRELAVKVDPDLDRVEVDGAEVRIAPATWIALHKPPGYVCTRRDPRGRKTVYDLLPPESGSLFTVGRLDADSEGLILLTNDGDTAHRLLHPRYGVRRVYEADVAGRPAAPMLSRLVEGVALEDGVARAVEARLLRMTRRGARVRLVLSEGRKREVRRMLAALGHPVRRLRRSRYGPIALGDLAPGGWRYLEDDEVHELQSATGLPRPDIEPRPEPVTRTE